MRFPGRKSTAFAPFAHALICLLAVTLVTSARSSTIGAGDAVLEWNQTAVTRVLAAGLPPPRQLRAMAIVQVSVHDAVNGITGKYETYLTPDPPADSGASVDGAAIAASYRALINMFGPSVTLDGVFMQSLIDHNVPMNDPGIAFGIAAANRVSLARSTDGAGLPAQCAYVDRAPDPGVWIRILNTSNGTFPPAALPCWKNVTPWVLRSSSQFRPEAPPSMDSERYAQDLNEVRLFGPATGSLRSAEQTRIATFWDGSPTDIWNQVLRQAVAEKHLDTSDEARAFALVFLAGSDASIACWEAKYFYHHWRPITAIARADEDGNPDTQPQTGWTSFINTWLHQHPEYPSGHSTNSSGMGSMMELIFGDKPGVTLTPTVGAITREWGSFGQGIDEVVDARVYDGLHFRFSDEAGARQGKQVARFVFTHALRQCKGSRCS